MNIQRQVIFSKIQDVLLSAGQIAKFVHKSYLFKLYLLQRM